MENTLLIGCVGMCAFLLGWAMPDGSVQAQDAQPVEVLPSFGYQEMKAIHVTKSRPDLSVHWFELPDLRQKNLDGFLNLTYLKSVSNVQRENTDKCEAVVEFSDTEECYMRWLDRIEKDTFAKLKEVHEDFVWWGCDAHWKDHHPAVVLLPPADKDGRAHEFTWVTKRHKNGRVSMLTPYIGNVAKGKGRVHGWQLEYNEAGNLLRMTPWVNGKRHGKQRHFDGKMRTRRQDANSTTEWAKGQKVVKKVPGLKKLPGVKKTSKIPGPGKKK
ncbi:MAG: toxin-antitoxin system YwqK family antitoxin [Planctomycetota bacterium]|jgi:hypothetical protein